MRVGHLIVFVKHCCCSPVRASACVLTLKCVLHLAKDSLPVAPKAALKALFAQLALDLHLAARDFWRGPERTIAGLIAAPLVRGRLLVLVLLVADDLGARGELALECILVV